MWAWYLCPTYVTDILVFFLFYAKTCESHCQEQCVNRTDSVNDQWSRSDWLYTIKNEALQAENFKLGYIPRSNQNDGAGNMSQFKSQSETPQYQTIQPLSSKHVWIHWKEELTFIQVWPASLIINRACPIKRYHAPSTRSKKKSCHKITLSLLSSHKLYRRWFNCVRRFAYEFKISKIMFVYLV